ncbi:sigma factor [Dactylosporangium sp. CA-052675]|uniref:sigma factor n=1 Tax=Dactylosporangium sp. CA-052675 TaxID=3239927 RepID=UPI003D90F813
MTAADRKTTFTEQCVTLVRLILEQDRHPLDAEQEERYAVALRSVTDGLPRLIRRDDRPGLEPEDIAQQALLKFINAIRSGRVDPDRSPSGYLLKIATTVASDLRRPGLPPSPIPDADLDRVWSGAGDDEADRLIEQLASESQVRSALALAVRRGDLSVVNVVHEWLNQARRNDADATQRAVAEAVGMSKSAVGKCLARFEQYLVEVA